MSLYHRTNVPLCTLHCTTHAAIVKSFHHLHMMSVHLIWNVLLDVLVCSDVLNVLSVPCHVLPPLLPKVSGHLVHEGILDHLLREISVGQAPSPFDPKPGG